MAVNVYVRRGSCTDAPKFVEMRHIDLMDCSREPTSEDGLMAMYTCADDGTLKKTFYTDESCTSTSSVAPVVYTSGVATTDGSPSGVCMTLSFNCNAMDQRPTLDTAMLPSDYIVYERKHYAGSQCSGDALETLDTYISTESDDCIPDFEGMSFKMTLPSTSGDACATSITLSFYTDSACTTARTDDGIMTIDDGVCMDVDGNSGKATFICPAVPTKSVKFSMEMDITPTKVYST
eukprot:TRINITY_DN746_c0_g1_i4.p1 TRINITY_DN746_c0_g1~~TRINITY_DN746_c0_g1_i4.p1  ORF type:complete len:235 (+),score=27.25 TRINITY_DN746_c0_g1_i4:985-1689(+)